MAMSAQILRELVSKVFGIKAKNVILSGEISPDFVPQNDIGHSSWNGAEMHQDTLWGFNPLEGFILIAGESGDFPTKVSNRLLQRDYISTNGHESSCKGEALGEHPEADSFIFFVLHSVGKSYGEDGEHFDNWSLFKAPDFKSHWDKLEKEDVERWESWLKNEEVAQNKKKYSSANDY